MTGLTRQRSFIEALARAARREMERVMTAGHAGVRVPVTVLTGFLGAGKTTLLRRILASADGERYGVLVNDFGALNIDAELVVEQTSDRVALQNGCVCCSIRDDLVGAIGDLVGNGPMPDRIIIEASGVSRPLAIVDALEDEPLSATVRLDGVFCLVDADQFAGLDFAATELAMDQVAGSDIVILNKIDLAGEAGGAAVEDTLRTAVPRLRVMWAAREADVPLGVLFEPLVDPDRVRAGGRHHNHHDHGDGHDHGHHADRFATWHFESALPVDAVAFAGALRRLPAGLLRAKGVFRTGRDDQRLVVQVVGKRREVTLEDAPAPPTSAFVVIGHQGDMDPDALAALFEPCLIRSEAV